jgi:hypothetical protein
MSQFHVVNESTEDTFGTADNLPDAICAAKEVARQGRAGDLVSILESGGQAVRQFVLLPDGTVAEQAIGRCVNRSRGEAGLSGVEQVTTADRPRDGGFPESTAPLA